MNQAVATEPHPTLLAGRPDNLTAFLLDPDKAMSAMYREHRTPFIRWASGWTSLGEADLTDIFQDCVIILLQNIRSGKLTSLTAAPRTYLFGIGKNLLRDHLRSGARISFPGEENLKFPPDFDPGAEHKMTLDEEDQRLQKALEKLGDPCNRLLRLTFYESKKSQEIATEMNYASEEVVRTQRKRCLDKLRILFTKS